MAGGEPRARRDRRHLGGHDWLVGDAYSAADISLYGYVHVADEGEFDLSGYPAIEGWLERVATVPGHVAMED